MSELILERRSERDKTPTLSGANSVVMLTPPIDEAYWSYRVRLTETQAIVGFPKFGTIGIGFAQEEDWNTNLPYTCDTTAIRWHIWHNRADEEITEESVDEAIAMVQAAAREDVEP